MGYEADWQRCRKLVRSAASAAGVPVAWPNRTFRPPGKTGSAASPALFVSAELGRVDSDEMGIRFGRLRLGVWSEPEVGADAAEALADALEAGFDGVDVPELVWVPQGRKRESAADVEVFEETWQVIVLELPFVGQC